MDQADQFKTTFFQECEELLGKLEHALTAIAAGDSQSESIHAAFRAIHSIKGGAGMFGFKRLVAFAHAMEGVFDLIRNGNADLSPSLVERALLANDVLADLVHSARTGEEYPEHYETECLEQLLAAAGIANSPTSDVKNAPAAKAAVENLPSGSADPEAVRDFKITFVPGPDMLRRGIEPIRIIRSLKSLGNLKVAADVSRLPDFAEVEPATTYLGWTFELQSTASLSDVREIFEFAEGSCQLDIKIDREQAKELDGGAATQAESKQGAAFPSDRPTSSEKIAGAIAGPVIQTVDRRVSSIRVDLERVDKLVNLVGEIVIAQAMVLQQIDQSLIDNNPQFYRSLSQLLQHTRSLQEGVMAIRAQPVRSIFSRMPRVVREVMQLTGKRVAIELSGEETEIDKTIIEELSDPLVHIIRNSVDHGIEPPEVRRASGKPETGKIRLSASQRGSRIVIQISDDGRGIDRPLVLRRAIERKLIAEDAQLTDEEIDSLIFLPGFSTASSVSDISGRGVGMDVVMSNIQKLGGRVSIKSETGVGTTTTLTLPLTLAVLEGMIVRSGGSTYLVPLSNIVECLVVGADRLNFIPGFGRVINVRGRQIRVIDLASTFGRPSMSDLNRAHIVLIETENGATAGFVVDEIVGQQQVVVKSVRENFGDVIGIAGATILGDGGVALILDVSMICELPSSRNTDSPAFAPAGASGIRSGVIAA